MNTKKIFFTCLVLMAVIASIGMVVAVSSNVNLPDGYSLDESKTISNNTTELFGVKCDFNRAVMVNGDKNITVNTYYPSQEITLTPSGGSVMKNISNIEGLYQEVNGRYIFLYSDNDQFVQIDAPDEKVISEVISK